MLGLSGKKMTLHGTGENRRRYLAVEDFAEAVIMLLKSGRDGEIYNIGSEDEFTNRQIAERICRTMNLNPEEYIILVEDRPFNDRRYAVDSTKLLTMGWAPAVQFDENLPKLVEWYIDNRARYVDIFPDIRP